MSKLTVLNSKREFKADYDCVVIGAGFSGLGILHHLNQLGLNSRVFESGKDVGGTWYWNRYPGARTDSEFYYYAFTFSKEVREEWKWKERYPSQDEVYQYLKFVSERLNLRKDITFNTKIESFIYDETRNLWNVTTEYGQTYTAHYVISAMGGLSTPTLPNIKGIDNFKGELYHTSHWPHDGVNLEGKRVGLLGVGASGIQITPVIAPVVKDLFVFQRTPNYVVASSNRAVSDEEMQNIVENYDEIYEKATKHGFAVPFERAQHGAKDVSAEERERIFEEKWADGGFHFMLETFNDLAVNEESNAYVCEFIRKKIKETVTDPLKAELLCPKDYPFNAKRPPGGHSYYEAFNRDNVHLVDVKSQPIEEITENAVRVGNDLYEIDVLICATGFDAMTGSLKRINIRGRDNVLLRDKLNNDGMKTNLGFSINGFPNLIFIYGPLTPYSNVPVALQESIGWASKALKYAIDNDLDIFETTPEAETAWYEEVRKAGEATIMAQGAQANAWFLGANVPGKPQEFSVYMGGADVFFEKCKAVAANNFATFFDYSGLNVKDKIA